MDEHEFPVLEEIIGCDHYSKIFINSKKFTIGRGLDNNYVIPVIQISRNHCTLNSDEDGKWSIVDTSSFGIFVNGIKIQKNIPASIQEGDCIQFGPDINKYKYQFTFRYSLEPPIKKLKGTDIVQKLVEKVSLEPVNDDSNKKLQILQQKLEEKERENEEMLKKLQETEENRLKELEELKKKQEDEKAEMLNRLQDELKSKEDSIRLVLQQETEKLEKEKAIINENIQKELAKKEGESAKHLELLQEELNKVKKDLDTVNGKKQMLETELNNVTTKCQENDELLLNTKNEVLCELGDVMETELQCSICNELFIETTTLNCMHSYCELCILQWRQKQNKCPICRQNIKSLNRTIVVDSFINKIVESLPEDMRKKRLELVNERKINDMRSKLNMKYKKNKFNSVPDTSQSSISSIVLPRNTAALPVQITSTTTATITQRPIVTTLSNRTRSSTTTRSNTQRRTVILQNQMSVPTIDLTNTTATTVVPDASSVVVISSDPTTNLNAGDMEVLRQFISANQGLFF